MLHKEKPDYNRNQYGFYTLDDLVPIDHFLRQVDEVIDFNFIYELVEDTYSTDNGRPSLDPVMLVKIPLIQCLYGIRSKMEDKVGLTLACLNIKKLVKMMAGKPFYFVQICQFPPYFGNIQKKTNLKNEVCLQSEIESSIFFCFKQKNENFLWFFIGKENQSRLCGKPEFEWKDFKLREQNLSLFLTKNMFI
ncbi:transposase [Streptococcus varani]|uniref:Transposase n=1 Tax=Streptococcus varani TaxID=1608583 RepID=A0A0E4H6P4_9STRE|nr:transposase [Streptococcus varani]